MIKDTKISEKILDLVEKTSPETVEKLIEQTMLDLGISKEMVIEYIIELDNQGKLKFSNPPESIPTKLDAYLFSTHAAWFWIIITLSVATAITVFTITEEAFPYIYIRYLLGSIFVLFLPGFSLIKTLFPSSRPYSPQKR